MRSAVLLLALVVLVAVAVVDGSLATVTVGASLPCFLLRVVALLYNASLALLLRFVFCFCLLDSQRMESLQVAFPG